MKTYQLGIMSRKWEVEAPNIDIATFTLRVGLETTAPIVCYNDDAQSVYMHHPPVDIDEMNAFALKNIKALIVANRTVKEIEL